MHNLTENILKYTLNIESVPEGTEFTYLDLSNTPGKPCSRIVIAQFIPPNLARPGRPTDEEREATNNSEDSIQTGLSNPWITRIYLVMTKISEVSGKIELFRKVSHEVWELI